MRNEDVDDSRRFPVTESQVYCGQWNEDPAKRDPHILNNNKTCILLAKVKLLCITICYCVGLKNFSDQMATYFVVLMAASIEFDVSPTNVWF